MSRHFSQRHGYGTADAEITVREDAPDDLRYGVAEMARTAGMGPKSIRSIACRVLLTAPDRNNWSDYPNVWEEALGLLESCEWYKVYDIAEAIWRALEHDPDRQQEFEHELNRFFREKGIGWELKNPDGIVFRGSEAFGAATSEAAQVLKETGRETAAAEIHEALRDISRRPTPIAPVQSSTLSQRLNAPRAMSQATLKRLWVRWSPSWTCPNPWMWPLRSCGDSRRTARGICAKARMSAPMKRSLS